MLSEQTRKLIILGDQPVISLPMGWVRFWNLQKKQPLKIICGSIIIIVPPGHPNKERIEKKIKLFLLKEDR